MNPRRAAAGVVLLALGLAGPGARAARPAEHRLDSPPRKVVVASVLEDISGPLTDRVARVVALVDQAAGVAARLPGGRGLDLMVFPEFTLESGTGALASELAVAPDDPALARVAAQAREHRTWLLVPMIRREAGGRCSNAAVLYDRSGAVAGIYRKVHPVLDDQGRLDGGVTAGDRFQVFDCDFGRLGVLVCWDMMYEDSWAALAAGGAELVAMPSASPQTLRPRAQALANNFYVLTSAGRDNVSLYDPIGRTRARLTEPGILVEQIDLAFAILHWSATLQEGRALTDRYGSRVGGTYSTREDTGIFWSNDPQLTIGAMVRAAGLHDLTEVTALSAAARATPPQP